MTHHLLPTWSWISYNFWSSESSQSFLLSSGSRKFIHFYLHSISDRWNPFALKTSAICLHLLEVYLGQISVSKLSSQSNGQVYIFSPFSFFQFFLHSFYFQLFIIIKNQKLHAFQIEVLLLIIKLPPYVFFLIEKVMSFYILCNNFLRIITFNDCNKMLFLLQNINTTPLCFKILQLSDLSAIEHKYIHILHLFQKKQNIQKKFKTNNKSIEFIQNQFKNAYFNFIKIIMNNIQPASQQSSKVFHREHHNNQYNPQKPNQSSYQAREERLNAQILRIKSQQALKILKKVWNMNSNQLINFFTNYKTIYEFVDFEELIPMNNTKLVTTDHKIYLGQVKHKQKHGMGMTVYKDGRVFEGEYNNNQKRGLGCQIYANGNMYVGEYHQNKKHGKGTFFWFTNCQGNGTKQEHSKVEQYEGMWWGGLPDGQGQHQKSNGDFYMGKFKNGLKHGQGVEYYSNGDQYSGQFVNGLPEGFGTYNWSDGSHYRGDFKQGFRNGYGVWNDPQGKQSYKGHYMLDRKHGYGIYDWANGYVYKGNFIQDQRSGQGDLLFNQNVIYTGFWVNGEKCDEQEYQNHQANTKTMNTVASRHDFSHKDAKNKSTLKKGKGKGKNDQSFLVHFKHMEKPRPCRHQNCFACKSKSPNKTSKSKYEKRNQSASKSQSNLKRKYVLES